MSDNISDDEVPVNVNYRKPEKKSVNEIIDADKVSNRRWGNCEISIG